MNEDRHVVDMLLKENVRLASEVDLLIADLTYLREVMSVMSRLLQEHDVAVPTDELETLERKHDERVKKIGRAHV